MVKFSRIGHILKFLLSYFKKFCSQYVAYLFCMKTLKLKLVLIQVRVR